MSSHDNHDHHSKEPKSVSFTVPFILAAVTLTIMFLFLSLCDPKKHGECDENCSEECKESCTKGDHSNNPIKEDDFDGDSLIGYEPKSESMDTMAVESPMPTADDTTHATHH